MQDETRRASRIALASVVAGVVLTGGKLVVGLATGSLGILSEAAHSLLDLGAALLTFFAVRAAARPADRDHPYGHGKLENLSALAEALLLLATCVWIAREAFARLAGKPVVVEADAASFAVMAGALVVDVLVSRVLYAGARRYHSAALEADALHYSSDILSSAVVIAGLVGVRLGRPVLDPLAALAVAVLVTVASIRLGKRAVDTLLDRAPAGLAERIERQVREHCPVERVERVRVRAAGPVVFVDLIAVMPRDMSLERSHELSDLVDAEVKKIVPRADVLVHCHPSPAGATVAGAVRAVAERAAGIGDVHDVHSYEDGASGRHIVTLHVRLAPELPMAEAHRVVDEFEAAVRRELPQVGEVVTHIETSAPPGPGRRTEIPEPRLRALREAVLRDDRVRGIHDVVLHASPAGPVLTCHIETRRELPLEEAHAATVGVETAAHGLFPDIVEVVVHAEPEP